MDLAQLGDSSASFIWGHSYIAVICMFNKAGHLRGLHSYVGCWKL